MNRTVTIVLIIIVILGIGYWYMNRADDVDVSQNSDSTENTENATSTSDEENASKTVKVTVTGSNFAFSEKEIRASKGDTVEVTFINSVGTHDFVIDEFNTRTKILKAGENETISFVADKTGSFEYYCSVGSHRQMGMKGTLLVE